jgi:hypothetical protein
MIVLRENAEGAELAEGIQVPCLLRAVIRTKK